MTGENHNISVFCVDTWDIDEIICLYRAGMWWKDEYDPREIPRLIKGSIVFAVAVDTRTGHAIGMGRVISDGISDGYIQDLVVLPEYRNQGVGKKIVSVLVRQCRSRGISWIALIAEPGSEMFYTPLGFEQMRGHVPMIYRRDA